jgi:hypothetical protein
MSSNSGIKLIEVLSYAINKYSLLPLISRMHLYSALQDYIINQENRIFTLETEIVKIKKQVHSQNNLSHNKK